MTVKKQQEQCVSPMRMQCCAWVRTRTQPCCHPGTVELNFTFLCRVLGGAADGQHPKHHAHVLNDLLYLFMFCQPTGM